METPLSSLIAFLALLNPFALCLYLVGVMDDLDRRAFFGVLLRASGMSFVVFLAFAFTGERILRDFLHVRPESMRIFGGVIFFVVGYNYVMRGYKTTEMLRGQLDELPSAIALPFMIGAGTITQAILVGKQHDPLWVVLVLAAVMAITTLTVLLFRLIRDGMRASHERVFDRYVNMLSRLNGLIIGAISVEMIVGSLCDLWRMETS